MNTKSKRVVYVIDTFDDGLHSFVDRELFFKEWAYQLRKKLLPCNAYIVDISGYDECDYRDYQDELEDLIMSRGVC